MLQTILLITILLIQLVNLIILIRKIVIQKREIDSEEVVNIRTPQSKIIEWQPPKPEQEKAFNKILKKLNLK